MRFSLPKIQCLALAIVCFCACALALPAHAQKPTKWALLVGIAHYKRVQFTLLGPINDVAHVKETLIGRGFEDDHIKVCMSEEATKKGILAGWDWLQERAKPGDLVVFYYSGHGTVLTPGANDTKREMRSALVPYDTLDASGLLPGSVIGERIDKLPTQNVVVIVDACHSGRASRMPCVRTRFISPALLGLPPEATPSEQQTRQWTFTEFSGTPSKDSPVKGTSGADTARGTKQRELYLGASRVEQTASEDTFLPTKGDYRTNANMGAFTYYLLQEVDRDKTGKLTYEQIVEKVRADLLRRYGREQVREDGTRQPTQEPQLAGTVPRGIGFLQVPDSAPVKIPTVTNTTPAPTMASISAPLRVATVGTFPADKRALLQKMPGVTVVAATEPSDAVVEAVPTGAKVWRGRIPLAPRAWGELPILLSRLQAAQMLERIATQAKTTGQSEGGVHIRAKNETGYAEAAIGTQVTLSITADSSGYVTLLAAAADGTLTGVGDIAVSEGQTLTFPATAKGPNGVDFVQVLLTRERLGLKLPASPDVAAARRPQETAAALTKKLSASPNALQSVDTVLVRIGGK